MYQPFFLTSTFILSAVSLYVKNRPSGMGGMITFPQLSGGF